MHTHLSRDVVRRLRVRVCLRALGLRRGLGLTAEAALLRAGSTRHAAVCVLNVPAAALALARRTLLECLLAQRRQPRDLALQILPVPLGAVCVARTARLRPCTSAAKRHLRASGGRSLVLVSRAPGTRLSSPPRARTVILHFFLRCKNDARRSVARERRPCARRRHGLHRHVGLCAVHGARKASKTASRGDGPGGGLDALVTAARSKK